jgi:putative SOS response-associated peptidase YedK
MLGARNQPDCRQVQCHSTSSARVRGPKSAPVEGNHELFGFLRTEANAIVAPIHAKAMPVIRRSQEEADRWLETDTPDALALQRPLPDDALRIVAKGEKEDAPPQAGRVVRRLNEGRWARQGPRLADFGC